MSTRWRITLQYINKDAVGYSSKMKEFDSFPDAVDFLITTLPNNIKSVNIERISQ